MGLIARLPFNNRLEDLVGLSQLQDLGQTNYSLGKLGTCFDFNNSGTKNYTLNTPVSRGKFSISYWGKGTGLPSSNWRSTFILLDEDNNIFLRGDTRQADTPSVLHYVQDFNESSWATRSMISNSEYTQWGWHHYVTVFHSPNVFSSYRDGQFIGTNTITQNIEPYKNISVIRINGSSGNEFQMSDFRLYDHALSVKEIKELSRGLVLSVNLQSDVIGDSSGLHKLFPTGTAGLSASESAWSFGGSNSYVDTDYSPFFDETLNEFTISTWYRHSSSTGTRRIFGARDNTKSGNPLIELFAGYTAVQALIRGTNGTRRDILVGVSLDPNKFHNLTWVCKEGSSYLYLNGELVGQNTSGYDQRINLTDVSLPIGATRLENSYSTNNTDFVREVKVYHTALSSSDVLNLYKQRASIDSVGNMHSKKLKTLVPVWRQFGGPLATSVGSGVSDRSLFEGSTSSTVIPYAKSGIFASQIDKGLFDLFSQKKGATWVKTIRFYNENLEEVPVGGYGFSDKLPMVIKFVFDKTSCLADAFVPFFDTASSPHRMPGKVKVFVNNQYTGETDLVFNHWSSTPQNNNLGLANSADTFGEPESNRLNSGIGRHIFSYVSTSSGQNAVRCQPVCWSGESIVSEVVWSVIP